MAPADSTRPPARDEVEVSLFGPGVGECALVHLGGGNWIVVDSCKARGAPAVALKYLTDLGIDLSTQVRLVVVTHWHDDHIAGIAEVFQAAKNAKLVFSCALRTDEFFQFARLAGVTETTSDSDVVEVNALFRELLQRMPGGTRNVGVTPMWALAGRVLLSLPPLEGVPRAEVVSLSPSDVSVQLSHMAIAERLQRINSDSVARRLVSTSPNEAAVVLRVSAGPYNVLLGSDLEESRNPEDGWQAIVSDHSANQSPRAHVLKVPHHGSSNADSPEVWRQMLHSGAHAILTPFRRQKLPKLGDLKRLAARTTSVSITADPLGRRPQKRDPAVERTMREVTTRRQLLRSSVGHVRLRAPLAGGHFDIALFEGAYAYPGTGQPRP